MRLGQAPSGSFRSAQDVGLEAEQGDKSLLDRITGDFLAKIKTFYENFTAMRAQSTFISRHPDLQSEYTDLMTRGTFIDTQIKRAKSLIEAATSAWDTFLKFIGLGELGVIPAIPIAIAAGSAALALITKWLADVYIFAQKVEAIKALEAKGGITSREAAGAIMSAGPTGILDVLQKNIIWIVVGGTLLLFGPEIIKWIRSR